MLSLLGSYLTPSGLAPTGIVELEAYAVIKSELWLKTGDTTINTNNKDNSIITEKIKQAELEAGYGIPFFILCITLACVLERPNKHLVILFSNLMLAGLTPRAYGRDQSTWKV
jgi:hypothetical protein